MLIGVSEYVEGLNSLPNAAKDIDAMKNVLQHPDMGGFDEVKMLPNPDPLTMQEAIENLFSGRDKDDLALFFFSGHGVKDDSGRLYFTTRLTRKTTKGDLVKATAVPANFVQDIMSNSRCKRQVVILDCCFSGAFAEGMTAKDVGVVDVQHQLGGEGRAVLTSSTSTQYSFEQKGLNLSVYTHYIVEGIETGAADLDGNGTISIENLHDYACRKVQESAPAMKPKIYAVEEGFKILVAKASVGDPKLRYRREVQRCASRGEINDIGRDTLDALQGKLGLGSSESLEIEAQVLKPYQDYKEKLHRYEQSYRKALQRENPLSADTHSDLKHLQEVLSLEDKDITLIESRIITSDPKSSDPKSSDPKSSDPKPSNPKLKVSRIYLFLLTLLISGSGGIIWVFSRPPIVSPTNVAQTKEIEGFQSLLEGDLTKARDDFKAASNVYPEYHNVEEIHNLVNSNLREFTIADPSQKGTILSRIFTQIVKKHDWGMPDEVRQQMKIRPQIVIEYFPDKDRSESITPVIEQLKAQGFNIIETRNDGNNQNINNQRVNNITFGKGIDDNTAKFVAKSFINRKVDIKIIDTFNPGSDPKTFDYKIQIGTEPITGKNVELCRNWTVPDLDTIKKVEELKRDCLQ